jgi:hypothetical protein
MRVLAALSHCANTSSWRVCAYALVGDEGRGAEPRSDPLAGPCSRERGPDAECARQLQGSLRAFGRPGFGRMIASAAMTAPRTSASIRAGWTTGTKWLRPSLSSM